MQPEALAPFDLPGVAARRNTPQQHNTRHYSHIVRGNQTSMPPATSHASKKRKVYDTTQLDVAATKAAQVIDILIPNEFCHSSAWENRPEVFKLASARTELLSALFDASTLRKVVKELEKHDPLEFGRDLNAARYIDGKRETPNAQVADSKTVWGLYRDGCTLQVHQPQRFQKDLAGVCSGLEQRLGCLVGINAYLTPPGTQGLAPHHDDVDIFVCQTEGSKRWRLYNPRKGFALPAQPSGDLPEDTLGDPVMDVTLQVGDVLYMPRGTVHQAVAQQDASTHLTISTYQNFSVGTLAQAVLHSAMQGQEEPLCLPLSLRRGLPPGFLYSHGYQADKMRDLRKRPAAPTTPPQGDDASGQSLAQQVAAGLRELADKVEAQPELISKAADLMSLDFMDSRAPPSEVTPEGTIVHQEQIEHPDE
ncbi:MAG: bifunctional lysine-specific demethylase and histidyl-hydroxylase NO66-like [Trebouxia sp. A1-2]|nr:MAG: bifunctional lysine-specific demethylase and histidyl-hydroxylase NO66-like [Trebouxia sp. A1-2]